MLSKRILTLVFVVAFLTLLVGCIAPTPPIENQAPSITSTPVTTAKVGIAYTYDVDATDPDGDTLTYSLTTNPNWMTIKSATGVIIWTPISSQVGNNAVEVMVSDGALSDTQSFTIEVSKPTPTPIPTKYYTITATVGANGIIDPSGAVKVKKGSDKTFTITPDGNYHIADVLVDGGSVGMGASYTFTNVTKNHTIHVTFAIDTYTIIATADSGGSISPLGDVIVDEGSDELFIITPTVFYRIYDVLVDGNSVGMGNSYTFIDVTEDHTIEAFFTFINPVYNQDKDEHYSTIQAAINDAASNPGDTILVMAGTYNESVNVDKSLTLQGEDRETTEIEGSGSTPSPILTISADEVTVSGFTIHSGVYLHGIDYTIDVKGDSLLLTDLHVIKDKPAGGSAIILRPGVDGFTFTDSTVDSEWNGIYVPRHLETFSSNILIQNVDFNYPGEYAVLLVAMKGATIEENLFNCGVHFGVVTNACDNIEILNNQFVGSGTANLGIWPQGFAGPVGNFTIRGNDISGFNMGIYMGAELVISGILKINYNNIFSNVIGVNNTATAGLDAIDNWWGDASGPYHPITNPLGAGDTVSDNVGYIPWSTSPN